MDFRRYGASQKTQGWMTSSQGEGVEGSTAISRAVVRQFGAEMENSNISCQFRLHLYLYQLLFTFNWRS